MSFIKKYELEEMINKLELFSRKAKDTSNLTKAIQALQEELKQAKTNETRS